MPSLNAQILAHLAGGVALFCALMLLRDYGRRWLNRHERARGEEETKWPKD